MKRILTILLITSLLFAGMIKGPANKAVFNQGSLDGVVIGATTPAAITGTSIVGNTGTFTTANISNGQASFENVTSDALYSTAANVATLGGSTPGTVYASILSANTQISANVFYPNLARTFVSGDATPDVSGYKYFQTNSGSWLDTFTGGITDFDGTGIRAGQEIIVESTGVVTFDVTSSGLKGGSADLVTADGDLTGWFYNGTDWILKFYIDQSDDLS